MFCWKQKLGHYEGHVLLLQMPSVLLETETGTVQRAYSVVIHRDLVGVVVFKRDDGGWGGCMQRLEVAHKEHGWQNRKGTRT